jgi:hypothetical protein
MLTPETQWINAATPCSSEQPAEFSFQIGLHLQQLQRACFVATVTG